MTDYVRDGLFIMTEDGTRLKTDKFGKKKKDSSVASLSTRIQSCSDGMSIEIKKLQSILIKKIVVVITISSVNLEEVNLSSSVISHVRISGLAKVSASSTLTEISSKISSHLHQKREQKTWSYLTLQTMRDLWV